MNPLILHQVWTQGTPTGEALQLIAGAMDTATGQGWAHWLWHATSDGDLVAMVALPSCRAGGTITIKNPAVRQLVKRCPNRSMLSNLMRWLILDAYGGLYLDADVDLFTLPRDLDGAWICGCDHVVNPAIQGQPAGHAYARRLLQHVELHADEWFHTRLNGCATAAACLQPDVSIWPESLWRGPKAVYGNHLYRGNMWRSSLAPEGRL